MSPPKVVGDAAGTGRCSIRAHDFSWEAGADGLSMKSSSLKRGRAHLATTTGARAVPARSTSLGRGGPENSRVFTPEKPLRTGTVRGPAMAVSCAQLGMVLAEVVGTGARSETRGGLTVHGAPPFAYA